MEFIANSKFQTRMIQRGVGEFVANNVPRPKIPIGRKIIISGVLISGGIYVVRRTDWRYVCFQTTIGNRLYSWIIDTFSSEIMADYRQRIKDVVLDIAHRNPRNHSHPNAARFRCIANTFMEHSCSILGRRSYHYQLSPTQQRLKLAGYRTIHCAKDVQMRYMTGQILPDDIIVMTDVDYYIDMNTILIGNPVLIYTFVPTEVAGVTEDGNYCTHSDNTVETTTNGGARYRHELWDYDNDHIVVDTWSGSYIYLVEQIEITPTRRVVFFNPIRKVVPVLGWMLPGRRLQRRNFNKAGVMYSRFTRRNDEGVVEVWHSMARPGESPACTIRSDTFVATFIRLTENRDPHISDVERYFNTHQVPNSLYAATLFYHIFKNYPEAFDYTPDIITPCVQQRMTPHTYQCIDGLASEDGKQSMRSIWPGYGSAFSPAKSENNDRACIQGRIKDVKNKRPNIPPIYYTFLSEFVNFMVPAHKRRTLTPLSFEEMWEQFRKPTQRVLLAQADYTMDSSAFVKSFQKREAYNKITAPRNISTLPMAHNATLGQFTIPLMTHIYKDCHWYAFGQHPRDMAKSLAAKAYGTQSAVVTDFEKLDGSIRGFFRDAFIAVGTAAFHESYHTELIRVEGKERHAKCSTTFGLKYEADSTILSGSSMTSLLGTLVNALVNYIALRTYFSPEQAWQRLGKYGGDDGSNFDVPAQWISRVAANFGMSCEAEEVRAGEPIKFLGRIYVDIWSSDQSIADVHRQLRKLHLTAAPEIVPNWLVLYRKAVGYRVTDPGTPLLTAWCDSVIRIVHAQYSTDPTTHKYWHLTKTDQSYWSKFDSPYNPPTDIEHARGIVASDMGYTVDELVKLENKFKDAKTLDDLFLTDILKKPVKVTVAAVYKGEVIKPDPGTKHPQDKIINNKQLKLSLCRFAKRGENCPYKDCKYTHTIAKLPQKVPQPQQPKPVAKPIPKAVPVTKTTSNPPPPPNKQIKFTPAPAKTVKTNTAPLPSPTKVNKAKVKDTKQTATLSKSSVNVSPSVVSAPTTPVQPPKPTTPPVTPTKQVQPPKPVTPPVTPIQQSTLTSTNEPVQVLYVDSVKDDDDLDWDTDDDDYMGHQSQCRGCYKWSKWIDDGKCDNYPYCKSKYRKYRKGKNGNGTLDKGTTQQPVDDKSTSPAKNDGGAATN
nr:MAG: hypothetical protein [Beijing sediment noda-like virus 7]